MELIFSWQGAVAAQFILIWLVIYFIFMRPRRARALRADSRFYSRYESRSKGWLIIDGKKSGIRVSNLNNSGALIVSRVPLAPGDRVFLHLGSARLMGWAEVRHCIQRRIFGYNSGVEFRGSLMRATEGVWQFSSVTRPTRNTIDRR